MKFKSDIEVEAGLRDYSGSPGTSGKILSSNGTSVSWIDVNALSEIIISGDKNNLNKIFTFANELSIGTTHQFFINGQLMKYVNDYTISGTTLTISDSRPAPMSSDTLTLYGSIGVSNGGVTNQQSIINSLIFG